jgi:hypothetical protein
MKGITDTKLLLEHSRKLNLLTFFFKKKLLFFKRKCYKFRKEKFDKIINIKIFSNNIFCSFQNDKKTIFSCAASRYNIKITAKQLRFQTFRVLTFFYHEIKTKLTTKGLIIKIFSPKFLKENIHDWCVINLSKYKKEKKKYNRLILYEFKNNKCFNGCRVKKKRVKKKLKFRLNRLKIT